MTVTARTRNDLASRASEAGRAIVAPTGGGLDGFPAFRNEHEAVPSMRCGLAMPAPRRYRP